MVNEKPPWWHEADGALSKIYDQLDTPRFDMVDVLKNAMYIKTNLMRGVFVILYDTGGLQERWFNEASALVDDIVEYFLVLRTMGTGFEEDYERKLKQAKKACYDLREMIRTKVPDTRAPQRESPSIPVPKPRKRKRGTPKYIR